MDFHHIPVMLAEILDHMGLRPGGIYVDCTLGGGGHSSEMVKRVQPGGRIIGIDQDPDALKAAGAKLAEYAPGVTLVHSNFYRLKEVLGEIGIPSVDGVLFDIGVSSHQLDEAGRGFSYMQDAPLDMRMNPQDITTAADLVNNLPEQELTRIIREYGEERWAKRIAEFIIRRRGIKPIVTTAELVEVIKQAIPAGARREGPHPAKRTFQALRIAVNDELGRFAAALRDAVDVLKPGGRVCVITFHSLEDRIAKETFRELAGRCTCPPELPVCQCENKPRVKVITNKPISPTAGEIDVNPRARSAKLRVAQKVDSSKL